MMTSSDEVALQEILGRQLDRSELAIFETLDEIPASIVTIVQILSSRYRMLACKYLNERVPTAEVDEVMMKVAAIMDVAV